MSWSQRDIAPLEHHRLLLVAALGDESLAAQAWQQWRRSVEFDGIDGPTQRLLPAIVRRPGVIPHDDSVRGRVRGMYRQTWVDNHRTWAGVHPVLDALAADRIDVMVVKGAALLQHYDDDWGTRPMYDIDLVVRLVDRSRALAVLGANGWRPELGQSPTWVDVRMGRLRHSWGHERGERERLDLHWRLTPAVMAPDAQAAWWNTARDAQLGGRRVRVLHPADLLLHTLLHGTGGGNEPPIQWIADATRVARSIAHDAAVVEHWRTQTQRLGLVGVATTALAVAASIVEPVSTERSLSIVADHLSTQRSLVDRLRTWPGPARAIVAEVATEAAGVGLRRGLAAAARRVVEVDVVTSERAAVVEGITGRSRWIAPLRRRIVGPLAKPPIAAPAQHLPLVLHLADPTTLDHHGGSGWRVVFADGAATSGRSASLVVPLAEGEVPSSIAVVATAGSAARLHVVVDGRRVASASMTVRPTRVEARLDSQRRWARGGALEIRLDLDRRGADLRVESVTLS